MTKPDFSSGGLYGKDIMFRLMSHFFRKKKNLSSAQINMLDKAEASLPTNAEKNKKRVSATRRSESKTAAISASSRRARRGRGLGRGLLG
ncbi:hypothetical protein [Marinobacter sp.]|uniref:hypothetical protein n=1 Tax=Marinobacter sp. TaxID=50741 RepID=UPI00118B9069|nr:hypothetical protein [Marinobacter sp.]QDP47700.1 MAG: hypothetical protein Tp1102SUR657482_13 [Prokaryotic dsDNA virus sp.]|tara:strand:- start:15423 stop:15692 length:270 start_codon:yes stop_codon:yes gene_type:complete